MIDDFLFHKISEKERKQIQEQANSIIGDFAKQLSKVDKKIQEPLIERDESEREEEAPQAYTKEVREPLRGPEKFSTKIFTRGKVKNCEIDRKIMFDNAHDTLGKGTSKNSDFIIAEKKGW